MRIFRIILTIFSPFLSIVQPTIERNSHHCQLCYQTYFSVTILKVTLLTVTTLTFLNKKLLTETTGRGPGVNSQSKLKCVFTLKRIWKMVTPDMLNELRSL